MASIMVVGRWEAGRVVAPGPDYLKEVAGTTIYLYVRQRGPRRPAVAQPLDERILGTLRGTPGSRLQYNERLGFHEFARPTGRPLYFALLEPKYWDAFGIVPMLTAGPSSLLSGLVYSPDVYVTFDFPPERLAEWPMIQLGVRAYIASLVASTKGVEVAPEHRE